MLKVLCVGLYASGHSMHVRTHKLSRVNNDFYWSKIVKNGSKIIVHRLIKLNRFSWSTIKDNWRQFLEIRCKGSTNFCEKACKMPCLFGKLCYRAWDGGNIYFQHVSGWFLGCSPLFTTDIEEDFLDGDLCELFDGENPIANVAGFVTQHLLKHRAHP